jgi:Transcriptional regulatory protein, C terminal
VRGVVLSTSWLLDVVWGPDTAARVNTLQSHVSYLRRLLGGKDSIVARPPGYQLCLAGDATDLAVAERPTPMRFVAGSLNSPPPALPTMPIC